MNKKTITAFLIMAVVAVVVVFGFKKLSRYAYTREPEVTDTTELGKLLNKDLENQYPATPREVMKFYNRVNSLLYNSEEISDTQFEELLKQMRMLFDQELLSENSFEDQLKAFQKDVNDYQDNKKRIVSYSLPENSAVTYYETDGRQMASLEVGYMLKEKDSYSKMTEEFILRQDEDKNWKILGWMLGEEQPEKNDEAQEEE